MGKQNCAYGAVGTTAYYLLMVYLDIYQTYLEYVGTTAYYLLMVYQN